MAKREKTCYNGGKCKLLGAILVELGQRIKDERTRLGLSQRQLCGDVITRNMLSQIENGAARPSMDTLSYLAKQLGKSVSYFLEEDTVTSPNQGLMREARQSFAAGNFEEAADLLEQYLEPDEAFDWEKEYLLALSQIAMAKEALKENRKPYARELLIKALGAKTPYFGPEQETVCRMLLAETGANSPMPDLTPVLLCKARAALEQGEPQRAGEYLQAADSQDSQQWQLLRGETYLALRQYEQAAECFHKVEKSAEGQVDAQLEQCYIGLEDYKTAYLYACKQKK